LRKNEHAYEWLNWGDPGWLDAGDSELSVGAVNIHSAMYVGSARLNAVSDGDQIIGAFENNMGPPDIFGHDLSTGRTSILTDLNPELHNLFLEPVERVRWRDRHGFHCTGFLIKPNGYVAGNHYPLVIMTKGWWPQYFLADTEYHTAFAPQPLASAGFLVLLAQEQPVEFERNLGRKYPGHYPGRLAEAGELKDIIDSGIRELVRRNLADGSNVGIMGFSTTSWKTDVLLTHSGARFRSASSADSGLWNYGLYWSPNNAGVMHDSEAYMGGPPYGTTFSNWRKFSPSFNAAGVKTPLLMEYISSGRQGIDGIEFFVALRKQNRPADLFFYPRGDHVLENPSERVASLQRNVDWFRFWMQDYEGQAPEYDPEQYVRWHALKRESSVMSTKSTPY
jgi:dipeptidyl aminopeptidase/acylaminoacyl peptidase